MHEGMKSRMALSVVRATSMVMRCHSGTRGEIDIATKEWTDCMKGAGNRTIA